VVILIDSREQRPLEFNHPYKDGFRPPIVFERKSIPDLFGTMGKGYKRFRREIDRALEMDVKLVILVEGGMSRVLKGHRHSQMAGISILRKMLTLWIKYGLDFHFLKDRDEMALFISEYFCSIGRMKGNRK